MSAPKLETRHSTSLPHCHCGEPLHYLHPETAVLLEEMFADIGHYARVASRGRVYLVPRHFIALHGLQGQDLAALGFEEVPPDPKRRAYRMAKKRNGPVRA